MLRFISLLVFTLWVAALPSAAATITILAVGDSLTAGFGVAPLDAFPAKLEAALKARGHDVRVQNAGVSGDTSAAAQERLSWVLTDDVGAVIVELGANDALRGIDPGNTDAALAAILTELANRRLPVLFAGMRAPPNLGNDYVERFDAIFPKLAKTHDVLFYPFFLEGVATDPALNQPDGLHPNAKGVDVIVARMLPRVEDLLAKVGSR